MLAVLARLDPPEAYLPDETEDVPDPCTRDESLHRVTQPAAQGRPQGRASQRHPGLGGSCALLAPALGYLIAVAFKSEAVLIVLCGGNLAVDVRRSVLGLVLGVIARKSGPWAVVGIVTSVLAPFLSLAIVIRRVLVGLTTTVCGRPVVSRCIAAVRHRGTLAAARQACTVDPVEQRLILARVLLEPDAAGVGLLGRVVLGLGLLGRFPGRLAQEEAVGRTGRG